MRAVILRSRAAKRPGITKRMVRAVDRLITRVQERLEARDGPGAEAAAYIILALAGLYLAGHLVAFILR